jgi:DNA-binding NarL/FixJ family response regulator
MRLLIADDNAEFRQTTRLMLSLEHDIDVVGLARDGREAVEQARQHQPDVAVLDVHMPKVDGLTAIRTLASVSPGTICVAMSYDGEREMLRQAMAAGAREYLLKPFSSDELVNTLRRVAPQRPPPRLQQTGSLRERTALAAHSRSEELLRLGAGYLRAGRSDDEAMRVYDQLVQDPGLDTATLTRLAEAFLARRDWRSLRQLCERLEDPVRWRARS